MASSSSVGSGTGSGKPNLPLLVTPALPSRKKSVLDKYETDETKGLTNSELQRLVLLEQLNTTRVQGEYFKEKLQRMAEKNVRQNISVEGTSTFFNM